MDKVEKEGNFARKKENNHSISNGFNININLPNEQNREGQTNSGESTGIQRLNKSMVSQEEIFKAGDIEISPNLSR